MNIKPLSRDELKSVIEGKSNASRIPMLIHFFSHPYVFGDRREEAEVLYSKYPYDLHPISIKIPDIYNAPEDDPEYRWVNYSQTETKQNVGMDAKIAIADWEQLDGILADFPNPHYKGMFPLNPPDDGRYRLGIWWYCFFERFWSLRGMDNALTDFYLYPEQVHKLFRALTDFYKVMIERAATELKLDGIFTSDDIGCQTGPFFSHAIFDEFFKPYYKEIIEKAHSVGLHFWLHACGNIEPFLPDFIEIGLDVIHPIQKYTMDEKVIAEKYGNDICIMAGFDVQRIIPYGTPEEVRQEVRYMIDTYYRKNGRFMMAPGNAIWGDCPFESIKALFEELYNYGTYKVSTDK